jgi:hypothetical protein
MTCKNCGNKMSCGCQKRVASNGTHVCSNCIIAYEASIKNQGNPQQINITAVTANKK